MFMKTPLERMIEAVEKGYNSNPVLWDEWKSTLLEAEQEMIKEAFLCGDDSEWQLNITNIKSAKEYMEYYRACK